MKILKPAILKHIHMKPTSIHSPIKWLSLYSIAVNHQHQLLYKYVLVIDLMTPPIGRVGLRAAYGKVKQISMNRQMMLI